jgi:hypothetical protein
MCEHDAFERPGEQPIDAGAGALAVAIGHSQQRMPSDPAEDTPHAQIVTRQPVRRLAKVLHQVALRSLRRCSTNATKAEGDKI